MPLSCTSVVHDQVVPEKSVGALAPVKLSVTPVGLGQVLELEACVHVEGYGLPDVGQWVSRCVTVASSTSSARLNEDSRTRSCPDWFVCARTAAYDASPSDIMIPTTMSVTTTAKPLSSARALISPSPSGWRCR